MKEVKRIIRRLELKKRMNEDSPEVAEAYEFALTEVSRLLEPKHQENDFSILTEKEHAEQQTISKMKIDEFVDVVWRDIREIQKSRQS